MRYPNAAMKRIVPKMNFMVSMLYDFSETLLNNIEIIIYNVVNNGFLKKCKLS
ncbi:MAG: hypothetical protein PF542_05375 [Nanoarchaeota archaeon]|nr:hypothetical protein [Nanoarchaeota archaeon]